MQISIIGAICGGIIDIVSSAILGLIPLAIWIVSTPGSLVHGTCFAMVADYQNAMRGNPMAQSLALGFGGLGSVIGGYCAARYAKRAEVLNGMASAWLCIAGGIYGVMAMIPTGPSPQHLAVDIILSLACAAFGGYLRMPKARA